MDWEENIVDAWEEIRDFRTIEQFFRILDETKTIAVLGIDPGARSDRRSVFVAEWLQKHGFRMIPVTTENGSAAEIFGEKVYRRLGDVPDKIDLVLIYTPSEKVPAYVDEILAVRPAFVWMNLGVACEAAARVFAERGMLVVQNTCFWDEYRFYPKMCNYDYDENLNRRP
ncbi:MAG: CoA-binding protein [Acidobacteria bacterium]|nr:CoA-binding protein [Acidobacteriota bacterium]